MLDLISDKDGMGEVVIGESRYCWRTTTFLMGIQGGRTIEWKRRRREAGHDIRQCRLAA
jgi:hypothetical protein